MFSNKKFFGKRTIEKCDFSFIFPFWTKCHSVFFYSRFLLDVATCEITKTDMYFKSPLAMPPFEEAGRIVAGKTSSVDVF